LILCQQTFPSHLNSPVSSFVIICNYNTHDLLFNGNFSSRKKMSNRKCAAE
jgi:hypothetical protein